MKTNEKSAKNDPCYNSSIPFYYFLMQTRHLLRVCFERIWNKTEVKILLRVCGYI